MGGGGNFRIPLDPSLQAPGVTIVNMAIANDAGAYNSSTAGQSVALHVDATADRLACFGCALLGAQDTLYTGCSGYGLRSFFFVSLKWDVSLCASQSRPQQNPP